MLDDGEMAILRLMKLDAERNARLASEMGFLMLARDFERAEKHAESIMQAEGSP